MTLSEFRRFLYAGARWVGHYQAARKGRAGQRLVNIALGRLVGRGMGRVWR